MTLLTLLSARLLLVATGDALMHQPVQQCAADSGYDFLYEKVAPLVRVADVAFVNMEFPVAPETGKNPKPFVFNAPVSALLGLRDAGFTVFNLANNHAFDQGAAGLAETCEHLDSLGMSFIGAGRFAPESERPLVVEHDSIRVAFLGYTSVLNINANSPDPFAPRLNIFDLDRAKADIARIRDSVDFVVVSVHWGTEYVVKPSAQQVEWAHALCDAGADLVLGHHPHVLEPVEAYAASDDRNCLIAYSMGNFISNQERGYRASSPVEKGDPRDGVLLYVSFIKDSAGKRLEGPEVVPLWTENHMGVIRAWPMEIYWLNEPDLMGVRWKRAWKVLGLPERARTE